MTRIGRLWLACFVMILCLSLQPAAAQDSLQFLLEADAAYQLKFVFPNRWILHRQFSPSIRSMSRGRF